MLVFLRDLLIAEDHAAPYEWAAVALAHAMIANEVSAAVNIGLALVLKRWVPSFEYAADASGQVFALS